MGLMMLWLVLAVHHVAGERSHAQHQVYNNVFFNPPSHTGRPSTSFVMVKSHDGRSYQLSNSGVSFIFSNDPAKKHKRQDGSHVAEELSSNSLTLPVSQCPEMAAKPDEMCVNKTSSCWSQGQPDVDCPGFGLCCFDGCVARCVESFPKDEVVQDRVVGGSCPQVEDRDPSQCSGATANCWSRGVPDVDCPNFGLCCYDGCVNTCLRDIDYDQSLSQGLEDDDEEEDDEYDDELDDQLDDELDDEYDDELGDQLDDDLDDDLGDQLDEYGAPKAAPIKYISDIDSYGSPLAGPVTSYQDILGNDLRTLSKKEHSGPIVTRNTIAGVRPFLYQSGPTGLGNLVKPKKNKISIENKSKRNLYKTKSAFSTFQYANGIDNNKVNDNQNYKKDYQKSTKFRSSKQFHPIFYSGGKPVASTIKRTESPVKNMVRKRLQLTEKNKGSNVMLTLEKLLKKHFSIFSYF